MSSSLHFATSNSTNSHISISFRLHRLPRIEQIYRRLDFDRQLLVTAGREADRYYDALTRQAYEDVSGFLAGPSNQRSGRPPALGPLFHQLVASTTATENDVIIGGFINERQNYATMEYNSWIEVHQTRYSRARPADRAAIRDEIISLIYSKPGHFLKFYGERRFYIQLTHTKVVEKVEQDLRTRRVSSFIRNNNSNAQRLAIFGAPRWVRQGTSSLQPPNKNNIVEPQHVRPPLEDHRWHSLLANRMFVDRLILHHKRGGGSK